MSLEDLKTQAKRLADHLAHVHGVRLKHNSVLDALACVHGAKNWQQLRAEAQRRPGLVRRAMSALSPARHVETSCAPQDYVFEADPRRVTFGVFPNQKSLFTLESTWLHRHVLVIGQEGYGVRSLLHDLCAQQVASGGGLFVLDTVADHLLPRMLQYVAEEAGREDFRAQLPLEVVSACEAAHADLQATRIGTRDLGTVAPLQSRPCWPMADLLVGATLQHMSVPCLAVDAPEVSQARQILNEFFQALPAHRALVRDDQHPVALIVSNAHLALEPRWAPALRQLRAYGVALVAQVPSLLAIEDAGLREALLSGCDSRIYYKPLTADSLHAAAVSIEPMTGPRPRTMGPNGYVEEGEEGGPADIRAALSTLGFGDALFVGSNFLQPMQNRFPRLVAIR